MIRNLCYQSTGCIVVRKLVIVPARHCNGWHDHGRVPQSLPRLPPGDLLPRNTRWAGIRMTALPDPARHNERPPLTRSELRRNY